MYFLALIGVLLIVLAVLHIIPVLIGVILGVVLIAAGAFPFYTRNRHNGPV